MSSFYTKSIYHGAQVLRKFGFRFNENSDERVLSMKKILRDIGGSIELQIAVYPDGSWTAESRNIDGIITGGRGQERMAEVIKDAIFTYFSIPSYLCKDGLLKMDNEAIKITQRVYA